MAWVGGTVRLPSIPESYSGGASNVSARVTSRQPQASYAASRSGHQGFGNKPALRQSQALAGASLTAASTSEDRIKTLRSPLDLYYSEGNSLPIQNLSLGPSNVTAQYPHTADNQHISQFHGANGSEPQSSGNGLPKELDQLLDPSRPVRLPDPNSISSRQLDNRQLDKLVGNLGKSKATWRRALVLYEWLKDSGHRLDDRLCTTLIRLCAEHGQAVSALNVYEWMRSPEEYGGAALFPTVYTYTAAMRAALATGMLDKAMQVWRDAQAAGCKPDCRLCITYIEVCSRLGLFDRALQMYMEMRDAPVGSRMTPTVHAYTAAMRAATEGGKWHKALEIWGDMRKAGCEPTGHAYAAGISACASAMDWLRAVQLFEEMCQAGIRPDVVSCTALITALASAGQWQRAESVVRWMLDYGLKPNVRTYTALMTALGNAKQWERAMDMIQLMQTPSWGAVSPNAYTYSALIKAMAENGEFYRAEMVFQQLEHEALGRRGDRVWQAGSHEVPNSAMELPGLTVSPWSNAPTVTQAVVPLGSPSQVVQRSWTSPSELNGLDLHLAQQGAQPLFSRARAPPQAGSSTSVGAASELQVALDLAAAAQQHAGINGYPRDYGVPVTKDPLSRPPAPINLTSQLNQYLGADPAVTLSQEMTGQGALPTSCLSPSKSPPGRVDSGPKMVNEVVCGALMHAYERAGKWEEAVGVLGRARALGISPNTVMYNTAISAAGKAGQLEVMERLFMSMRDPDNVTYETVIAMYGMSGQANKADVAMRAMISAGFKPRDYAYCGLIAAYGLSGDWQGVQRVKNTIRREGYRMTVHVYNALLAACERCGKYDEALELLAGMKRRGVEPNGLTHHLMGSVGKKGAATVEHQQITAAAMSAALAAAGTILIRTGVF